MDNKTISVAGLRKLGTAAGLFILRQPVVFPFSLSPVNIEIEENQEVVREAMNSDRTVAMFPQYSYTGKNVPTKLPMISTVTYGDRKLSRVGVLARVVRELRLPDGSSKIVVRGLRRIYCELIEVGTDGIPRVQYRDADEDMAENADNANIARAKSVLNYFHELSAMVNQPEELVNAVEATNVPGRIADILSDAMHFSGDEKVTLLALTDIGERLDLLAILMARELEIAVLGMSIQNQVQEAMGDSQREFFLREQLRVIKRELGEEPRGGDIAMLEKKMQNVDLPENVEATVKNEIERLECIPTSAPEYHISYSYVNWLLDVPWNKYTEDRLDCAVARKVLEEDHYGLEDVKDRILEFLAVLQLRQGDPNSTAPILCLIGPPGVGKTSIGQSIARAMNRNFIRVSLGGVRDEAEIRGHRRTYVGAMPGRIIQNLKRAGSSNPVFMLDEVDKLAQDFRGDPGSALLEVLDPAQNHSFNDNYIELGCDLSKVFFIATANSIDGIPGPLRDRMEIIRVPGYTALEKREIAKRYLVPRQIKNCGLENKTVSFRTGAVDELIKFYTMEAGVRELERVTGQICRRLARKIVEKDEKFSGRIIVDKQLVVELLGKHRFQPDGLRRDSKPGYALGMAWTGVGGTVLPVEILAIPGGKGQLKLTGSLGKVMQESAETAFSFVRSIAKDFGTEPEFFNTNDFHIHVPDGATPKDGPSAGITLVTALVSLISGKRVKALTAMSGEVTLHGHVTAVGGIREKVTAACQAGVTTIILPEENIKDAEELPEEVKSKITFHYVKECRKALEIMLGVK